jgi:hypothetical protein
MHNRFGAYRNLQDTTVYGYERYLDKQYNDKACCCGITPKMFAPMFQRIANKMLGVESYEEWKARMEDHNRFILEYRLAEDALPISREPSPNTPVALPVKPPWEML